MGRGRGSKQAGWVGRDEGSSAYGSRSPVAATQTVSVTGIKSAAVCITATNTYTHSHSRGQSVHTLKTRPLLYYVCIQSRATGTHVGSAWYVREQMTSM